jgi:hypothetical protein
MEKNCIICAVHDIHIYAVDMVTVLLGCNADAGKLLSSDGFSVNNPIFPFPIVWYLNVYWECFGVFKMFQ